jgi:hypothetical protein
MEIMAVLPPLKLSPLPRLLLFAIPDFQLVSISIFFHGTLIVPGCTTIEMES